MSTNHTLPFLKLDDKGNIVNVDYVALAKEEERLSAIVRAADTDIHDRGRVWVQCQEERWVPEQVEHAGKLYRDACLARQKAHRDQSNFRVIRDLVFPS